MNRQCKDQHKAGKDILENSENNNIISKSPSFNNFLLEKQDYSSSRPQRLYDSNGVCEELDSGDLHDSATVRCPR